MASPAAMMGWMTWELETSGCSSTTGILPRSLVFRHLDSLSLITPSNWWLIIFPINSLLPGPAAATTWSWSVMQESMPVDWERDSAYSFAKMLSSPIGEYFFKMISPSRSVKISRGVPSLIRRVRRISLGMTTLPRSSDCVNQVQKIFVKLRKALKYKDSSAFGAFTPVLLIESF